MSTVHNPTNFEPADYIVEDYLDNRRPEYFVGEPIESYHEIVRQWEADMARALGPDWRAKAHHCVHCGNGNIRWITAVRHLPTHEVVVFGSDCTERLGFPNKVAFRLALLKSRADARTARFKIWQMREDFLAAHPDLRAALACLDHPEHAKNTFAQDIARKLDQFGSLSDKQVSAVLASLQRDREYAAKPVEVKGDAPTGRADVTGTVVSVKEHESAFGITLKMTLKLDNNARVWCTVPSGVTVERGDRVTVRATWTRSDDDTSFAFGKRPMVINTPTTA